MTWRVYRPGWVSVYVSTMPGARGERDCLTDFARRWGGRVGSADWQVLKPEDLDGWVALQLWLPALEGEFAAEADAGMHAGSLPGAARVVRKGSAEERELRGYGRRQA